MGDTVMPLTRHLSAITLGVPLPRRKRATPLPAMLLLLAGLFVELQALDLITGVRMMQAHGPASELNPLARTAFAHGGPLGLAALKLAAVVLGGGLFLQVARRGQPGLAGVC